MWDDEGLLLRIVVLVVKFYFGYLVSLGFFGLVWL